LLVTDTVLTPFQAKLLLKGRVKGFFIGPYKVLDQIGQGGMGAVYLCEHTAMGRLVAVKLFPQDKVGDPGALERFYREARAVAVLDHPNIVRAYDVNRFGELHILVMEYVPGETLQAMLTREGPLPPLKAVGYAVQTAVGLQHAHDNGLVHRDIKPANLMLDRKGVIKILDMGLARFFEDDDDNLTERLDRGSVMGTIDYLAPEQALDCSGVDNRADIYSLGATLYSLLKGASLYRGTTAQKLIQLQMKEVPPLCQLRTDVPRALSDVVTKMLAKRPEERHQSMAEVIDALGPWTPAQPTLAPSSTSNLRPAAEPPRLPKWVPTKWAALSAGLAAVALLIGVTVLLTRSNKEEEKDPSKVVIRDLGTTVEPPGPQGQAGNPAAARPPAGRTVYRLDLAGTKPFTQRFWGRTDGSVQPEYQGPAGWGTHSWQTDCAHEFFCETRDGRKVLGIRVVAGPASGGQPGAMIFARGVEVMADHEYTLRIAYLTNGGNAGGEIRVREDPPGNKLRYQSKFTPTGGAWATVAPRFKVGSTNTIQVELFHVGPVGEGNELFVRELELIDRDG
jgi:serine/threonine protein kinase